MTLENKILSVNKKLTAIQLELSEILIATEDKSIIDCVNKVDAHIEDGAFALMELI